MSTYVNFWKFSTDPKKYDGSLRDEIFMYFISYHIKRHLDKTATTKSLIKLSPHNSPYKIIQTFLSGPVPPLKNKLKNGKKSFISFHFYYLLLTILLISPLKDWC